MWVVVVLAVLLPIDRVAAQERASRFEIVGVGDSTITLRTGQVRWIYPGQLGIAVDPRKRDALVARIRVLTVRAGQAEAVITGQTTPLNPDHVAIFIEPRRRFFKMREFWFGLAGGAIVGFIAGQLGG
jgi:hypothetical protein